MPFQSKFDLPKYDLETEGNLSAFQAWEMHWRGYVQCSKLKEEAAEKQAQVLMLCQQEKPYVL